VRDETVARQREMLVQTMPTTAPAKLAAALAAPSASAVSGQIFALQGEDIAVMSQIRSVDYRQKQGGWTPADIVSECIPALTPSFTPLGGTAGGSFTRPAVKA
jgi:hypothetical protein